MMNLRRLSLCSALVMAMAPCEAAHADAANLVKNGGFEIGRPGLSGSKLYYYPSRHANNVLPDWTTGGMNGDVAVVGADYVVAGITLSPHYGKASLNLAGTTQTATGIGQMVPTVSGATYRLKFWVGNVVDPDKGLGTSSTVIVSWSNTLEVKAVNSAGAGSSHEVWQKFVHYFRATGPQTLLTFVNGDPPGDGLCGLDGIRLTKLP